MSGPVTSLAFGAYSRDYDELLTEVEISEYPPAVSAEFGSPQMGSSFLTTITTHFVNLQPLHLEMLASGAAVSSLAQPAQLPATGYSSPSARGM